MGVAVGLHRDGLARLRVAARLARRVPQARVEPARVARRAGAYPQRRARPRERPHAVDPPARVPADVGGRGGEALGRSDLVVLPVLAPEIPGRPLRNQAGPGGAPAHRRVRRGRRRLGRRRVALERPDHARLDRESGTQDRDARDGAAHRADGAGAAGAEHVDCRPDRQRRRGGAPGVVGQHVYAGERHVPARGGGLGGGDRRVRRRDRRLGVPARHRPDSRGQRQQLHSDLHRLRAGLRLGLDHHSRSRSAARAREHRMNRHEVLTMNQSVPRRAFLTATAASVAGAGLTPSFPLSTLWRGGQGVRPEPLKLGVASYSLRNFPRDKAIEMVKALGTPYINLKSMHLPYELSRDEVAAARREIEGAGLHIVGGGVITFEEDTDEGVGKYFAYAKAAGMPLIAAHADAQILPRIERFAKQYDIKVAIHNHGPEDTRFPSPYDALKHVRNMDRRMGLCIDIGHAVRAGTDVVRAIADAGPRVLDMHAKDLRDPTTAASQCIVGEGVIPIAAIFRELETIGYRGYVNLEYEIDADDPLPGMKQSLAYMRGALAGLDAARRSPHS